MTTPNHLKEGLLLFNYMCDELGVELACWFEHEPAERGARSRFGEQLEPDYPATWSLVDFSFQSSLKTFSQTTDLSLGKPFGSD